MLKLKPPVSLGRKLHSPGLRVIKKAQAAFVSAAYDARRAVSNDMKSNRLAWATRSLSPVRKVTGGAVVRVKSSKVSRSLRLAEYGGTVKNHRIAVTGRRLRRINAKPPSVATGLTKRQRAKALQRRTGDQYLKRKRGHPHIRWVIGRQGADTEVLGMQFDRIVRKPGRLKVTRTWQRAGRASLRRRGLRV